MKTQKPPGLAVITLTECLLRWQIRFHTKKTQKRLKKSLKWDDFPQIGSSPQMRDEHKKYLKFHHLEITPDDKNPSKWTDSPWPSGFLSFPNRGPRGELLVAQSHHHVGIRKIAQHPRVLIREAMPRLEMWGFPIFFKTHSKTWEAEKKTRWGDVLI